MREAPVLDRAGGRTAERFDVGKHFDGGGDSGCGDHAALMPEKSVRGKAGLSAPVACGATTAGIPPATPRKLRHHVPVFGIDAQGSAGGSAGPFWKSSMEMLSGVRMKAMCPSRGGRLMVTPPSMSLLQVA